MSDECGVENPPFESADFAVAAFQPYDSWRRKWIAQRFSI